MRRESLLVLVKPSRVFTEYINTFLLIFIYRILAARDTTGQQIKQKPLL